MQTQAPRNCVSCKERKVRCDLRRPCLNCTKANRKCVFPTTGRILRHPSTCGGTLRPVAAGRLISWIASTGWRTWSAVFMPELIAAKLGSMKTSPGVRSHS
ncbi:hypothetical protein EDB81DRAFT_831079 [Dactylonectria macrodidyma]|uniref:Zn(2)-C6 fungal-type domain-containing protein n=1 Tax=Dactylonectria macrodidyma TaxID=307937 RepID=A0A9P9I7P0_9HYPO|nr:hypothetical protein EDB81DRAFT_831079 [Dactylonectria macrodidyma]